jgi:D-beta-D-heptose 7-phosphate kinase/D-beta-D-heptose 1-phosphate adenosyltransferase
MNTQAQKLFKILLIGDSCTDKYLIGSVDRLSPEAPVPVLKIVDTHTGYGMASNVLEHLEKYNCQTVFITNQEEIVKTRYIDSRSGQHMLRVDDEPTVTPWNSVLSVPLDMFDAIVISDYDKGFLTYEHIRFLIDNAKCPVFIDTKKKDLAQFEGAIIKINLYEFNNSTSRPSKLTDLIVTYGDKGVVWGGNHVPAELVELVDVCGAGDTFLAALVYQYLMTNIMLNAIIFANRAASITVQHRGNYAPTLEEIYGQNI